MKLHLSLPKRSELSSSTSIRGQLAFPSHLSVSDSLSRARVPDLATNNTIDPDKGVYTKLVWWASRLPPVDVRSVIMMMITISVAARTSLSG